MAVAVSTTGTALIGGSSVSTINYTGITVGAGLTNGALVVTFAAGVANAVTGLSATWDVGGTNQAMTLIGTKSFPTASQGTVAVFGLRAPTAGNKTLTVSWTGANFPTIEAITFTGVDQTSNAAAFKNFNSASGAVSGPMNLVITSAVGDLAVTIHGSLGTLNTPTQTQIYLDTTSSGADSCAQRAAGAATVTFSATNTASTGWAAAGFDLGAAGAAVAVPMGWEVPTVQPPTRTRATRAAAFMPKEDGIEFPRLNWRNAGWEVQSVQPPHPRVERAGSLMTGDPGNQAIFVPPVVATVTWSFDLAPMLRRKPPQYYFVGDDGTEAKFIGPVAATASWGFDNSQFQPPSPNLARQRGVGIKGKSEFAIYPNFYPAGWEIAAPMLRRKPALYSFVGDDGTEGTFTPPVTTTINWGFESPQLQATARPSAAQRGAVTTGGDSALAAIRFTPWVQDAPGHWKQFRRMSMAIGIEYLPTISPLFPWGYDQQPVQPPYKPYRSGAWARAEDGTQSPLINFFPHGWPIAAHQPGHPRPERAGAIMAGEPGNEAIYVFQPAFLAPWGYDTQPFQPPHPRPERFAGIMRGDDGSQAARINFFPFGWEVQPVQPGHPSPERRAAAIMPREDGIEQIALRWLNFGWEIAPHQPAHPRPEKAGGIMPLEPGNEGIFTFIAAPFVPHGYDPTAYMPRVRFARAGALARGEDGTEGLYSVWLPLGWQTPEAHGRGRRGSVGAFEGARGTEQPPPGLVWGFDLPDTPLRRQMRRTPPDQGFVLGAIARFTWADIVGIPLLPTRRRTQIRAEFNLEARFVFVPPPPVTFVSTPDNLLRRSFFHPAAAIMQFDGGWFHQRYVPVFYANSTITQAQATSVVTQARAETVASQASSVTKATAAGGDTAVTAALSQTVVSGETPGR